MQFGVLGTANIARVVVPAIEAAGHEVVAVGSRDPDRGESFADDLGIARAHGDYERLLDDGLDAVYNPLPNALHAEWARKAADRGLPVLCEKPLAADAEAARTVGDYCDREGVTLMEAFMYRYHPRTERVLDVLEGFDVRSVEATFQFSLPDREDVRLDPDLAGGSLMDVGCYAVDFALAVLGLPDRVVCRTHDGRDCGVETRAAGVLEYDDGRMARIASGFDGPDHQRYRVDGADGWLTAESAFVPREDGVAVEYERDGRRVTERFDPVDQYRREVEAFVDCVRSGDRPRTDADGAVRTLAVIDALGESARRDGAVAVDPPVGDGIGSAGS